MPFVTSSWISPRPAQARLTDDSDRFAVARFNASSDEDVIVDARAELTPSQAVENRLVALLREASLPVSHLQARGLIRGRRED